MKKLILSMLALMAAISMQAMSYQEARDQALFLTDKMAYELNLNEQQYEAAYEINLDYLMDVNTVDDVYAFSWRQRNQDLRYILLDWQYTAFCAASYFFRPLYWSAGNWHFSIYTHYPRHDFFYFSRPACYVTYRGGHSWRCNGGASWYAHRTARFHRPGVTHAGMRDSYRPAPRGTARQRPSTTRPAPQGGMGYRRPAAPAGTGRPTYTNRPAATSQQPPTANYRNDGGRGRLYNRESSTRTTVTRNAPQQGSRTDRGSTATRQPQRGNTAATQRTTNTQRTTAPRTTTRTTQSNTSKGSTTTARMSRR